MKEVSRRPKYKDLMVCSCVRLCLYGFWLFSKVGLFSSQVHKFIVAAQEAKTDVEAYVEPIFAKMDIDRFPENFPVTS